jgi:hypothetical protein
VRSSCAGSPRTVSASAFPGAERDAELLARIERGEERISVFEGLVPAAEMRRAEEIGAGAG